MRIVINRQFIFEFLSIILLLLPLISFITYTLTGAFFNFNNFYFIVYLCYIGLSVSYMRVLKIGRVNFFVFFILALCFTLFSHIKNLGAEGIVEFLRSISGYYVFIFLGWLVYKIYFEKGNGNRFLKIIVLFGIFIAIINILHFIIIVTDSITVETWKLKFDRYDFVIEYLYKLNKLFYDYIVIGYNYDNALRPVGYFFDTHSQYYMPLTAVVILIFSKNIIRNRFFFIMLLLSAILFSSIKTALLSIVILSIVWLLVNGQFKSILKYTIPSAILIGIVFRSYIINMISENMFKIIIQLSGHILYIPILFFKTDPFSFLFGGAPFLRNDSIFYSEIFWASVTFYIGFVGVLFYLSPIKILRNIKIKGFEIGAYVYLLFVLSLMHYSVYMIGVNNLASALPFAYFFAIVKEKDKSSLV